MQSLYGDRRKNDQHLLFPLMDSEAHLIMSERRSGKDRRKNRRGSDVAGNILNILN